MRVVGNILYLRALPVLNKVPREELLECVRLAETSECYITIVKGMCDVAATTVRSAAGLTEEF